MRRCLTPACVVSIEYDERAAALRGERLELEGTSHGGGAGGGSRTASTLRARLHGRARTPVAPQRVVARPSPQVELDWDPQNDPETDFDLDEVVRTMRIPRDRLAVDSPVRLAEARAAAQPVRAPAPQSPLDPGPLDTSLSARDEGPWEADAAPLSHVQHVQAAATLPPPGRSSTPAPHMRPPLQFGGPTPDGSDMDMQALAHSAQTRALLLSLPGLSEAQPTLAEELATDEILLEELDLAEPSCPSATSESEEPEPATGSRPRPLPPRPRETRDDYDAFAEGAPALRARVATPAHASRSEQLAELLPADDGWARKLRELLAARERRAWLPAAGVALALAGGAAILGLRGAATVELTVEVSPADAQVSLDGHALAGAGARHARVTRGPHQLQAQKSGFVSEQRALSVGDRASSLSAVITLAAVQKSATLSVSSIPSGALIRVDGRDTGKTTPAALVELPLGAHAVGLTLEGYVAAEQGVRLPEDALVTVSLTPVAASAPAPREPAPRETPQPPAARESVRAMSPAPQLTEALLQRRARVNAARATCRHAGRAHEPLDPEADEVLRAIGESCKSIMEAGAAASAR